ncbi:precorrin-6y C5,15-methyltransferase (decarboxylating) subunit CbiE [Plantactinospora sp. KLBMP9567]|uniref:precorrin-6y C5,15-methyltransferase (decarboxylating) subunit CbiE n=1 Tax=Plantactinospora sp. KLBMP9567 TaxID=3085900 RepID=UPI0029812533|nr:precorrin-6y C5,15-methyltransferase (decarboxylating) subunit CbiE [Plantactinospora sp. KLBMP9567]MDW5330601.1 precorrin-6y C5,15-methyltransferase (decarboxylating) subunit CbiE [Plantactinospora sp. KLBMP9567]
MTATSARPGLTVVGIGAEGWAGLGEAGRRALRTAEVVLGGGRQLDLLPAELPAHRVSWPSPLLPALPGLLDAYADRRLAVLASGDPMWFGIGARIVELVGPDRVQILPHPSSISLACARLGWPVERVSVVSAVGRDLARVRRVLAPGRRILLLSADASAPSALAGLLTEAGYGASPLTVLASLGTGHEQRLDGTAQGWPHPSGDPLNVVAVHATAGPDAILRSTMPGLPDEAYAHDGALTKREARALALARLAPAPDELLWDVGAGSGSIGIEWLRAEPTCRAVAVEARADRAERIAGNASMLGVPELEVVVGRAPAVLAGLPTPDAVFVGGGLAAEGVLDACWAALAPGGRLVAHAVTIEGERELTIRAERLGGDLTRLGVERAAPLGGFTAWKPARALVQWAVVKPCR